MDLIVAQMTTPRELLLLPLLVFVFVLDVLVIPEPLGISGGRCKSE